MSEICCNNEQYRITNTTVKERWPLPPKRKQPTTAFGVIAAIIQILGLLNIIGIFFR